MPARGRRGSIACRTISSELAPIFFSLCPTNLHTNSKLNQSKYSILRCPAAAAEGGNCGRREGGIAAGPSRREARGLRVARVCARALPAPRHGRGVHATSTQIRCACESDYRKHLVRCGLSRRRGRPRRTASTSSTQFRCCTVAPRALRRAPPWITTEATATRRARSAGCRRHLAPQVCSLCIAPPHTRAAARRVVTAVKLSGVWHGHRNAGSNLPLRPSLRARNTPYPGRLLCAVVVCRLGPCANPWESDSRASPTRRRVTQGECVQLGTGSESVCL